MGAGKEEIYYPNEDKTSAGTLYSAQCSAYNASGCSVIASNQSRWAFSKDILNSADSGDNVDLLQLKTRLAALGRHLSRRIYCVIIKLSIWKEPCKLE